MTEEEKATAINDFMELTAKHTLAFFHLMGLETHMEATIVNDANGDVFHFQFKKING